MTCCFAQFFLGDKVEGGAWGLTHERRVLVGKRDSVYPYPCKRRSANSGSTARARMGSSAMRSLARSPLVLSSGAPFLSLAMPSTVSHPKVCGFVRLLPSNPVISQNCPWQTQGSSDADGREVADQSGHRPFVRVGHLVVDLPDRSILVLSSSTHATLPLFLASTLMFQPVWHRQVVVCAAAGHVLPLGD